MEGFSGAWDIENISEWDVSFHDSGLGRIGKVKLVCWYLTCLEIVTAEARERGHDGYAIS